MAIIQRRLFGWLSLAYLLAAIVPGIAADEMVAIRTDFPGGNVRVQKIDGNIIHLAPDMRDSDPWFYWYFSAETAQPGRVTFMLGDAPLLGTRGPAISLDDGNTWNWLGTDNVRYALPPREQKKPEDREDAFFYDFTTAHRQVRFAVCIPYLQQNLQQFLQANAGSPYLTTGELTKSRQGQSVTLLQIGAPGPGVKPMLVTARHHACEAMASYVLEGLLKEALSDSPAAVAFRKQYVLYAVPIVDVDGVEAGDQGKGRAPHDHNRDYGQTNIYPEIKAIQQLAEQKQVQFALDFHCPTLRREEDTVLYFDGLNLPLIRQNVEAFSQWIAEEKPQAISSNPYLWLKQPPTTPPVEGMPFSNYFAYQKSMILAATLECPYTLPYCPLDATMARAYGASLLRAWSHTAFTAPQADEGMAQLKTLRANFLKLYQGAPEQAEQLAARYFGDATAPALYRAEANNLMGLLRLRQQRYTDARQYFSATLTDAGATQGQRATAMTQRTLATCTDPTSTPDAVERALAEFATFPYPAPEQQAQVFEIASGRYEKQGDAIRALAYAQQWLPAASKYDQGKVLNRIAVLYDALKQPEQAIAVRRHAVEILRQQLDPMPNGIFGAMMSADLFDALNGIPTSTVEEKMAAAQMVLNHPIAPAWLKDRMRAVLAELGQQR